ncbi:uncharacterized protein LOC123311270 isoform X1 [Coccinella septempunctata]|uniref:uncharacterized protein LOC123311270 isoform X1 n=1 Tax=Coccinella septempunctata TaxID=41139 RepID=UPI001D08C5F2|nr:uncharacterized protein LOC123311270 isoform X1 [Coccinella septempunctata]
MSTEFLTGFIELYRRRTCLWKVKSPEYSNRRLKNNAYEELVKYCNRKLVNEVVDVKWVKRKIKTLRNAFRKEYRKVEDSKQSGQDAIYESNLWYFDLLLFTKNQEEPIEGTDTMNEEPIEGIDTINEEQSIQPQQIDEIASLTQDSSETNEENEQETTNTERQTENGFVPKKRRIDPAFEVEAAQKRLTESFKTLNDIMLTKQDDLENECVLYTKLLATKLRRYPVKQRQRIMYQIDGLLLDNPPESCTSIASFLPSSQNYPVYPNPPSPTYSNSRHCQPSPDYSHDSKPSRHQ